MASSPMRLPFAAATFSCRRHKPKAFSPRSTMSSFPFEGSTHAKELKAAIDVVERACNICNTVQKTMLAEGKEHMNKTDQSPVTVADFGIQSLVSMELGWLFPTVPIIAEEDASFLKMNLLETESGKSRKPSLVDVVADAVSNVASAGVQPVNTTSVLEAIDRGGELVSDTSSRKEMSTYWVLDPIDGTRGFLEGGDALYVIGLALVVEGKLVLGVMGCPSLTHDNMTSRSGKRLMQSLDKYVRRTEESSGVLMAACYGYGSWLKQLLRVGQKGIMSLDNQDFVKCCVNGSLTLDTAWCGLSRHERWDSFPLANVTYLNHAFSRDLVVQLCCGSLCKYMAVAIGAVSVVLLPQPKMFVKVWDHAAGIICVLEAGGKVTDTTGSDIEDVLCEGNRMFVPGGGSILVSNGHLHSITLAGLVTT